MLLDLRSLVEAAENAGAVAFGVTTAQGTGTVRVPQSVITAGRAGYLEAVARRVVADQRPRITGTGGAVFAVTQVGSHPWDLDHQIQEEDELLIAALAVLMESAYASS